MLSEGDLPYVLVDGCHSFGALEVGVGVYDQADTDIKMHSELH